MNTTTRFTTCAISVTLCAVIIALLFPAINVSAEEDAPWTAIMNPKRDYLGIIVNQDNPYDFEGSYEKRLQDDLVYVVDDVYGDTAAVEKAAYFAYTLLKRRLAEKKITIGLLGSSAGYRSYADQEEIYLNNSSGSFEPGYSEHHTGLVISIAVQVKNDDGDLIWREPDLDFRDQNPKIINTILEELPLCGFILRYPEGKESITGIYPTFRDIRFIGSLNQVKLMTALDICLEEYLAQRQMTFEEYANQLFSQPADE